MFTVCVSLVLDSKYLQSRIICSLLCSIIVDTFEVDPHLIQYEKCLVKPTNRLRNYNHFKCVSDKYGFVSNVWASLTHPIQWCALFLVNLCDISR